jgi:hypothetical protein
MNFKCVIVRRHDAQIKIGRENLEQIKKEEFKSVAKHVSINK